MLGNWRAFKTEFRLTEMGNLRFVDADRVLKTLQVCIHAINTFIIRNLINDKIDFRLF